MTLLHHLFRLLNLPETPIRDKAVNFSGIITLFAAVDHTEFRLSLAPISIFSKVSCSKLLPFFPSTPKTVALLADLSNDPAPLVSNQLALFYHRIPAPPVSLADRLATDPIDAVRVAFCHSVPTLCKRLENRRHAVNLAGDPCWLVRYVLASNVGKTCDNLPDDVLPKNIQTVTLNLLQDEEVEVRRRTSR